MSTKITTKLISAHREWVDQMITLSLKAKDDSEMEKEFVKRWREFNAENGYECEIPDEDLLKAFGEYIEKNVKAEPHNMLKMLTFEEYQEQQGDLLPKIEGDSCSSCEEDDGQFLTQESLDMLSEMFSMVEDEGEDSVRQVLEEVTRKEYLAWFDPKTRQRGDKINKVELDTVLVIKDKHVRTIWKVQTQTGTRGKSGGLRRYQTMVEIQDWFPFIQEHGGKLKEHSKFMKTANIKVYCSCPHMLWGGARSNLGKYSDVPRTKGMEIEGYKYGYKGRTREGRSYEEELYVTKKPDIRDKSRKHVGCKHLYQVAYRVPFVMSAIIGKIQRKKNIGKPKQSPKEEDKKDTK